MNRFAIGVTVATLFAVPLHAAHADEGMFRMRLVASSNNYELSFDKNGPTGYKDKTAKASYTMKGVGLTAVSAEGVYLDFVAQRSGETTHDLWSSFTTTPQPFEREEAALTLGISSPVSDGALSAFLGLRTGTSTLHAPPGVIAAYTFTKDKFTSNGMFFGGGFAFPALGGSVGLNAALALMSGKWTDDHAPNAYNNKADTTVGFSLGASYTYLITKNFGLGVDWKFNAYNYNFAVYSTTIPAYTVSEKISAVGANLFAQF